MAIKEALSWIKQRNWPRVEPETDCLVVVKAIRSKISVHSRFGQIIEHCRREIELMNKIYLYFIKRSAKVVAHQFTRASYKYPDRSYGRSNIHTELRDCILLGVRS